MRPVSIVVEGFFAYREKVTLDLAGVDYFSIAGQTGAGKSSLIDAMVFALYGRVPRLGGRVVAPVITAGQERARVSFVFEVDDEQYVATRLVQRTNTGGANVKEARLQAGDETLASGAAEVTRAITDLLRLTFEDFTRTVVLPQGEFARFLQAPPAERQQLLRGLLGLDIYGQVRVLSQHRENLAKSKESSLETRIAELEVPTADEIERARTRTREIADLNSEIAAKEKSLEELAQAKAKADVELHQVTSSRERLDGIASPPRLEQLDQLIGGTTEKLERLSVALEETVETLATVDEEIAGSLDMGALDRTARLYLRMESIDSELAGYDLGSLEAHLVSVEEAVSEAQQAVTTARDNLDRTRVEHAAHGLAEDLEIGDMCPVCQSIVIEKPNVTPGDMAKEVDALARSEAALEASRTEVAASAKELAEVKTTVAQLGKKRSDVVSDLEGMPREEDIDQLRSSLTAALIRRKELSAARENTAGEIRESQRTLEDLAEEQRSVRNLLMSARERVADLEPEPASSDDPIVLWKEFMIWRESMLESLTIQISDTKEKVEAVEVELVDTRKRLATKLTNLDIPIEWPASVAVARAHEQSIHRLGAMEQTVESNTRLAEELESARSEAAVANSLAGHLRADGFERWLMVGAMADLVARANNLLAELSEDGYSLQPDSDGSFDIIDHRNADELRPISTLSGGETFMVSLALALSLAETLSAGGAGQLDAIILDEGFGTLDSESLDIVSGVLEGLSSRGLMVGIITHVKDLAARAPVRFAVTKGLDGSKVELVS